MLAVHGSSAYAHLFFEYKTFPYDSFTRAEEYASIGNQ